MAAEVEGATLLNLEADHLVERKGHGPISHLIDRLVIGLAEVGSDLNEEEFKTRAIDAGWLTLALLRVLREEQNPFVDVDSLEQSLRAAPGDRRSGGVTPAGAESGSAARSSPSSRPVDAVFAVARLRLDQLWDRIVVTYL